MIRHKRKLPMLMQQYAQSHQGGNGWKQQLQWLLT